jgi:hypothetical protein
MAAFGTRIFRLKRAITKWQIGLSGFCRPIWVSLIAATLCIPDLFRRPYRNSGWQQKVMVTTSRRIICGIGSNMLYPLAKLVCTI